MSLVRFGVSLDEDILKASDKFVNDSNLPNRSQAIRHLIEKNLVEKKWQCNHIVAGAVVLHSDDHKGDVTRKSNDIQYEYQDLILSSQHFHLSQEICLEIVTLKGIANLLTGLFDKLIGIKGMIHGKLVMGRAK